MNDNDISAYEQAVESGQYIRSTGLRGKYDHVRVHWEDEITRLYLRPCLEHLVDRRKKEGKDIRILDLGCGSGDGLEMLMNMIRRGLHLSDEPEPVIPDQVLAQYRGIDINEALLQQAEARFGNNGEVAFQQGDFSQGLPLAEGERPFDVYFTGFGTLSHLHDDEAVRLLSDVATHADDGALVVCDWLGRYAYEWQQLWDDDTSKEQWMDYVISYIYPEEERDEVELDSFQLRLMARSEALNVIRDAVDRSGVTIQPKRVFDRSLFVGRDMDTGDYNPHAAPLRSKVNELHEPHLRTDLEGLILDTHPRPGFDEQNRFFDTLGRSWNALVQHTTKLCERFDEDAGVVRQKPDIPAD